MASSECVAVSAGFVWLGLVVGDWALVKTGVSRATVINSANAVRGVVADRKICMASC